MLLPWGERQPSKTFVLTGEAYSYGKRDHLHELCEELPSMLYGGYSTARELHDWAKLFFELAEENLRLVREQKRP